MMNEFSFTIPLPPVGKKNSQQILINSKTHRPFISQNKRYKDYAKDAGMFIPRLDEPIDYPIIISARFYMPSKRRVDTVNLEEALWDVLVDHGFIADDCRDIIAGSDGTRTFYDKGNPRTEVYVRPLNEQDYEVWRCRE